VKTRDIIGYLLLALGLLVAQVLVLDNLDLGVYLKPQILVLLPILLPMELNKTNSLLVSFFLGLAADFLLNTHGIHAFSMTLVVYLRYIWLPKEDRPREDFNVVPSLRIILNAKWFTYVIILTSIYHFVFFSLEFFSFYFLFRILVTSILSTLLALLFEWFIYFVFLRGRSV
jgi:rod shape-determining protein MreD